MRIPGYNGDMEEPWYWENYGKYIYEYSYYTDKDRALCIPDRTPGLKNRRNDAR